MAPTVPPDPARALTDVDGDAAIDAAASDIPTDLPSPDAPSSDAVDAGSTLDVPIADRPCDGGCVVIRALTVGDTHTCAQWSDGSVRCWGGNTFGQIGDGTTTDRPAPTAVTGLGDAADTTAGSGHTCARRADGTVWCWGDNAHGQLGDDTTTARTVPTLVPGLNGVVEISANEARTCARLGDGSARCWGDDCSTPTGRLATARCRRQLQPDADQRPDRRGVLRRDALGLTVASERHSP